MPILTTPPLIGGASRPVAGLIVLSATSDYEWEGDDGVQHVTAAPQAGVVRDGMFYDLSGTEPLHITPTPPGVALRIVLKLGRPGVGGGEYVSSRTVKVPDVATVSWPDLEDVVPAQTGGEWVTPPWAEEVFTARTEAIAARDAAVAALADALAATVVEGPMPPADRSAFWLDTSDSTEWWDAALADVDAAAAAGVQQVNAAADARAADHKHTALSRDHDLAQLRLSSGGQVQYLNPAGTFVWEIGTNGDLARGQVPWARVTGAPELRDSGWRNVDALLANGWTGSVRMRRVGATVELRVEGISNPSPAATSTPLTMPSGFSAEGGGFARLLLHTTAAPPVPVRGFATNTLTLSNAPASQALYGTLVYTTLTAWPATLPGTVV